VVIGTDCIDSKSNYHDHDGPWIYIYLYNLHSSALKSSVQCSLLQFVNDLGTDHLTWRGGLWFFVSFIIFFSDNTRVRIFFFLSRKAQFFFPEFNIRLYDTNSESDFFFVLHQNQNIFFSNIGNQNIFFRKKP
jgi:hypothetical protein